MAYHSNGGYSGDERESRSGGDDRPVSDLTDKPIYLLEHLATFTVNKETGIVYPADGMRRLLQLEKTTGIWSQKMQLCLDYQWVLIMDYETGNIIERFPASLIQEPTAFTSNDPMEMYNNILVFIVTGGSGSRSEMHIFQSQGVSAIHLVEDLKQLRSGKFVTQHREAINTVAPQMKSSSSIQHRGGAGLIRGGGVIGLGGEQTDEHSYGMSRELGSVIGGGVGVGGGNGGGHETDSELGCANDETSSTSSDKYERDVTVLNHCFDDIEKFIARLQHAAAASRELERRRRNRKSKKKDPGEGLLTLRTRPPHEKEFIDIFAKFKLSFNLLAKLKAHIHDPNAPELVHFLFTPLALIVEASSDTYFESQLPVRVVNPLLTREAINLLINCVTSKETELWRSLGDAWTVPRDQWKEDVGSYHPVFLDGWSPDYLVIDELDHMATPTNIKRRIESHHNFGNVSSMNGSGTVMGGGDYDYDSPTSGLLNEKYTHHHHHHQSQGGIGVGGSDRGDREMKDFSARSDISLDSIERSGGVTSAPVGPLSNSPSSGLMGNGTHSHLSAAVTAQNAALQSITGGMQNLYSRNAANGGGSNTLGGAGGGVGGGSGGDGIGVSGDVRVGASGDVGGLHGDDQMIEAWLDDLQATGAKIVLVTYPRTANNDKELSVVRGEYLEILDDSRKWWKARNSRGQVAHVPHTIVTPYNYNENELNNQFYSHNYKSNARQSADANSQSGEMHQQNSAEWVRNKHTVSMRPTVTPPNDAATVGLPLSTNVMQEELKQVLRSRERRDLEILKTPQIYIEQMSTPSQVEAWLRAKEFSEKIIKRLHRFSGEELFALPPEKMEEYFGFKEGRRLASQVMLQKSVSGYKTARTTELHAVLARARPKSEMDQNN